MVNRVLSLAAWALVVVATASCSAPAPTAEQTFDALVVGSPTPLTLADKGFLDNNDAAQQQFAAELGFFWDAYNSRDLSDLENSNPAFLEVADDAAEAIETELERLEIDLFLTESQDLRDTFAPYIGLWWTVHDALVEVREGVAEGDLGREQRGSDAYAEQIAAVAAADFARIARAIDQLDPETAREFLEAEGLNPQDFGL